MARECRRSLGAVSGVLLKMLNTCKPSTQEHQEFKVILCYIVNFKASLGYTTPSLNNNSPQTTLSLKKRSIIFLFL